MEIKAKNNISVLDANYPLLVRLRESAPGTFSHSKNVAAMLENISAVVDLQESNLTIAGMYHDIGKVIGPHMFTENQIDEDNPHNVLSPVISLRYITAHVGDTARILVGDPNIPLEVIQWCTQHHGTTVAKAFYNKAKKDTPDVNRDLFRYPGPKPSCLESAILMICDILEATSRSKAQSGTLEDIDGLVETVITNLERDEQLDDVPLTFGKLRKIKQVLAKQLKSEHHKRVDYGKDEEPLKPKKKAKSEEEIDD